MDKQEAKTLLTAKLAEYRRLTYAELVVKIGDIDCLEVTGLLVWNTRSKFSSFGTAKPMATCE